MYLLAVLSCWLFTYFIDLFYFALFFWHWVSLQCNILFNIGSLSDACVSPPYLTSHLTNLLYFSISVLSLLVLMTHSYSNRYKDFINIFSISNLRKYHFQTFPFQAINYLVANPCSYWLSTYWQIFIADFINSFTISYVPLSPFLNSDF